MRSPLRFLTPIFLILAAGIFLLDQAGAFGLGWILNLFWPALLLCLGLEAWTGAVGALPRRRWGGALMAVGVVALADNFNLLHLGLQRFWPLALAAVGVSWIAERSA